MGLLFFLAAGAGAEYALALLPVAAAGGARKSLGALVGGGLGIAFVGAAGYSARTCTGRNALADHVFLGALAAATPAAHAASALATAAATTRRVRGVRSRWHGHGGRRGGARERRGDWRGRVRAPRARGGVRVPVRPDGAGARHHAAAGRDLRVQGGQAGGGDVLRRARGGRELDDRRPGAHVVRLRERLAPVRGLRGSYRGAYDARDWYGKDRLRDCLRREEALVAAYDVAYPYGAPPPSPPPPPSPEPPEPPLLNATSLANGTSANGTDAANATEVSAEGSPPRRGAPPEARGVGWTQDADATRQKRRRGPRLHFWRFRRRLRRRPRRPRRRRCLPRRRRRPRRRPARAAAAAVRARRGVPACTSTGWTS